MSDDQKQYEIQRKRDYHRKWRAEHPESVKAAQMRYWARKLEQMNQDRQHVEIREDAR